MLEPVSRSDRSASTDKPSVAPTQSTVAQIVADVCVRHGVRQIYGLPGGGSSLDVMQAFAALGVRFVLAHTEAAAGMMAAADAEAHGGLGVVVTTQGPGTASVANAIAHASLDRVPILVITDGWTKQQVTHDSHQVFDQRAMLAPVVKAHARLDGEQVAAELERLIAIAGTQPCGPVYLELTGENARRKVQDPCSDASPAAVSHEPSTSQSDAVAAAIALIEAAQRPVIVAGLEACAPDVASRIGTLAAHWQCPVLTTYKAKGVVADESDYALGLFTGGALERSTVESADLIVLCGFDPVELIGRPWPYTAPVVDLSPVEHVPHYVEPAVRLRLPLAHSLDALAEVAPARGWSTEELGRLKAGMRERLAYAGNEAGLTPVEVVEIAAKAAKELYPRITVDAGAHMFSAMAFWPAKRPRDVLISNGLASMAFALPAGVAMGVSDRTRQVIALTGDGGLLMCIGELATAVREGVKLCVVVFNDSTLSLIQIKQQSRGFERDGIEWPRIDFAAIARGFGMKAFSVATTQAYENALREAFTTNGPCLIDVHVDPSGYLAQSKALRG